MRHLNRFIPALVLTLGLSGGVAHAAGITVVHGIPGSDIGQPNELPVDIALNGLCAVTGAEYQAIAGPLEVDPGLYAVSIYLTDGPGACQGTLVIQTSASIAFGDNNTIVAHLTPEGAITATSFRDDVRAIDGADARVVVRHTADAPAVDVYAGEPGAGAPAKLAAGLQNPDQAKSLVPAGDYKVGVVPAGTFDLVLGPLDLSLDPGVAYFVYAVGSVNSGTLTALVQAVDTSTRVAGSR